MLKAFMALALLAATPAHAAEFNRWTGADDADAALDHVLAKLSEKTGYTLKATDFRLGEDRALAYTHYQRWEQVAADGVRVKGMAVRLWTEPKSGALVQLEAQTEKPIAAAELEAAVAPGAEAAALQAAEKVAARSDDARVRKSSVAKAWDAGRLVYVVTLKAKRGTHVVTFDAVTRQVVREDYKPYETADLGAPPDELSVPALVYPIYEEYGGQLLPREPATLRYIKTRTRKPAGDPFADLRTLHFLDSKRDEDKGNTPDGRAEGFWSMRWLKGEMKAREQAVPLAPNDFAHGTVLLDGRFATINVNPDAFDKFPGVTLPKVYTAHGSFQWKEVPETDDYEIIPTPALASRGLESPDAALTLDATRHPTHDPATYLNAGFDGVQVYYAINVLMEELRARGFRDPDLGERPFHAFLYDPDIESQDNAYYTDDTINFTTYTPKTLNMARDNTTIWHELGHGVMDRLMGDELDLADTGGLSEGMADFVAEMVVQAATGGASFPGVEEQRIINGTGFFLTNESHDDGEAYGGAMKGIMDGAIARFGRAGVDKVVDVILEAMRLSRDHPALTAQAWFDHVLFADQLGRPGLRAPGELAGVIREALAERNFYDEAGRAGFRFEYNGVDLARGAPGTRGRDVKLELAKDETSTHVLTVQAKDGTGYRYKFPVEVKVYFNPGPLQGALHWVGEEQEPLVRTLQGTGDVLQLPVTVTGTCDAINRSDGTCSDFAYVQLWEAGATKPVAKKRFYLRVKTKE